MGRMLSAAPASLWRRDMALVTCSECGQQISDKAPACPHCGMPAAQPAPPAVQAQAPPAVQPVSPAPQALPEQPPSDPDPEAEYAAQMRKAKDKKVKVLALVGAIVVVAIFIGGYAMLDSKTEPTAIEACKKMALAECSSVSSSEATGLLAETHVRIFSHRTKQAFDSRLQYVGQVGAAECGERKEPCDVYLSEKNLIIVFASGGDHKAVNPRLRWLD